MYNTRKQKKNTLRKTVVEVFSIFLKTPHLLFRLVSRCNALVKCESLNNIIYTLNKESILKLFFFPFFRVALRFYRIDLYRYPVSNIRFESLSSATDF